MSEIRKPCPVNNGTYRCQKPTDHTGNHAGYFPNAAGITRYYQWKDAYAEFRITKAPFLDW